jgi:hypothetical protein
MSNFVTPVQSPRARSESPPASPQRWRQWILSVKDHSEAPTDENLNFLKVIASIRPTTNMPRHEKLFALLAHTDRLKKVETGCDFTAIHNLAKEALVYLAENPSL